MEELLSNNAYSIGFPGNLKVGYIYSHKIFNLGTNSLMENSKINTYIIGWKLG